MASIWVIVACRRAARSPQPQPATIDAIGPTLLFLLNHLDTVIEVLGAAGVGFVVSAAIKSLAALGAQFIALAAEIGAATAAEEGFAAASAGASGAGGAGRGRGAAGAVAGGVIGYESTHSVGGAVGGAGGWVIGAEAGAAIGTAIAPGIGTAIGAVLGGLLGAWSGAQTGDLIQKGSMRIYHHIEGGVKITDDPQQAAKNVGEEVTKNVAQPIRTMQDDLRQRRAASDQAMVRNALGSLR